MTNKSIELTKELLEKSILLLDNVKKPLNETDRNNLRLCREYAITILCITNELL